MGIPELAAKHAVHRTGNASSELAVGWYFENMDDPTLADALPKKKIVKEVHDNEGGVHVSDENVMMVSSMGFPEDRARKALSKCDNNVERAIDYLFNHPEDEPEEEMKID
jgi:ubiquitin carboxyl-terminal hydrolase 5/13